MEHWYNFLPLVILMGATILLLVEERWQRLLIAFSALYFGEFLLLIQYLPFGMALAKLITGVVAAVILYISRSEISLESLETNRSTIVFKSVSLLFFWVVSFITAGGLVSLIPLNYETICAAMMVIFSGLLVLGMNNHPMKVTMGILILYAGFDLVYGAVESSILVNGLLAVTTLLIALVGVYISTAHVEEVDS